MSPHSTGRFVIGTSPVDIAVIVVTYNSESDIGGLIESLRPDAAAMRLRVIVADNESVDGTRDIVRHHDDVVLLSAGGNLGYAGGINVALHQVGEADAILILNPDLRVGDGAVQLLADRLGQDASLGAVVPRMLSEDGSTYTSLRREPSLLRGLSDALIGSHWLGRPPALSEYIRDISVYDERRIVDWATGAAMLIRRTAADAVGAWDERFFLYSEETDFSRRLRSAGWRTLYEPAARVTHRGGGSGASLDLVALTVVNRVRYMEKHRPRSAGMYRAFVILGEELRRDPTHVRARWALRRRARWSELPRATRSEPDVAALPQVSVIVPAHNEAPVIARTLQPLAAGAAAGRLDVIVSCNGCTDRTAEIARGFDGVTVIETDAASKPVALNAADDVARFWPRIYLDADITIRPEAIADVVAALEAGALAARPASVIDDTESDRWVRAYYRARHRMTSLSTAMWGAGVYALSAAGHDRLGRFPEATADDLIVDQLFSAAEKTVVQTTPVVVTAPRSRSGLEAILRRAQRGPAELGVDTGRSSSRELLRTIAGPGSLRDAVVYALFAARARLRGRAATGTTAWERDESSRTPPVQPTRAVDHVILTRFNLPTPGPEALIRAQDGWLRNRVALFEKYTVPSLRAQTEQSFRWIVYLDVESPQWLRDRLAPLIDEGLLTALYREEVGWADVARDARELTGATGDALLTTNLDNDDAVAADFVERLQDAARTEKGPVAIFLRNGLIAHGMEVYLRDDRDNAFCSVSESWEDPQTAWRDWHTLLHTHFRTVNLGGDPGWLQVVHGQNVSNKVHGALTSPSDYRRLFPALLDEMPGPRAASLFADRLVRRPIRSAMKAARTLAKNIFLRALGKQRLDAFKEYLQGRRYS
jgi:GT2 family glycosyltransferase